MDSPDQLSIKRIEIDRELCIGAASCIALVAEAFELDAENKAVLKPGWTGLNREQLLNVAKACPVAAIFLYGPDDQRIYPES